MLENLGEQVTSCSHARTERRVISTDYFKRQFLAEVDVCKDCGAKLWTIDTQQRFQKWVVGLKQDRREVFQIQFYMTPTTKQMLLEFLKRFPGVPMSALLRAMTAVYLRSLIRFHDFQEIANKATEGTPFRLLTEGRRFKTSVQFSPMALLDVQAWSDILKQPQHKIVEDAVTKLLALQTEENAELKQFWEQNLLPHVELILRSF